MNTDAKQQIARELTAIEEMVKRRAELRAFADFTATHDPVGLANAVDAIPETLVRIARIEIWFRAYAQALRRRQPQ